MSCVCSQYQAAAFLDRQFIIGVCASRRDAISGQRNFSGTYQTQLRCCLSFTRNCYRGTRPNSRPPTSLEHSELYTEVNQLRTEVSVLKKLLQSHSVAKQSAAAQVPMSHSVPSLGHWKGSHVADRHVHRRVCFNCGVWCNYWGTREGEKILHNTY
mgnify:CR=1 FL=1